MSGWIVLHRLAPFRAYSSGFPFEDMEWEEVTVRVDSIFAIGHHVPGWQSGCIVMSSGPAVVDVRETRDEVIALCEGARKGRM